jgi:hypothetical protein
MIVRVLHDRFDGQTKSEPIGVENAPSDRAMENEHRDRHLRGASRRGGGLRILALVAGTLFLFGLWARGLPAFVAWEVAGDHQRCFGRRHLPARVWSSDPAEVQDWLESRGTPAPPLPSEAGQAALVGARYCPLSDRVAAHVYYGGDGSGLGSVFVLSVRPASATAGPALQLHVRLLHATGRTLAVVGEQEPHGDDGARLPGHSRHRGRIGGPRHPAG